MSHDAQIPSKARIRFRSWAVLVVVALGVAFSCFLLLYQRSIDARTVQLVEMAKSQARLMEAMGKFNAFFQSGEVEGAARSATLSQIREGHRKYTGFGETGEGYVRFALVENKHRIRQAVRGIRRFLRDARGS